MSEVQKCHAYFARVVLEKALGDLTAKAEKLRRESKMFFENGEYLLYCALAGLNSQKVFDKYMEIVEAT